jgi:hypothetical protein
VTNKTKKLPSFIDRFLFIHKKWQEEYGKQSIGYGVSAFLP